ncbi:probable protein arginine N-methyltransferase 6.1 [Caerostris darwini]|uniref:Protein arginine N-methyltransferase 6 n=1 Tax=Caerostris darwini TaxID=1538125 RepID=A0AAV4Q8V1_9ARAC|nr:probable protein arginine N-methyltransferase 6.1 [Caerostris darwini]
MVNFYQRSSICLQWIPSHVGVFGNEVAYLLAKDRSSSPLPPPLNFLLPKFTQFLGLKKFLFGESLPNTPDMMDDNVQILPPCKKVKLENDLDYSASSESIYGEHSKKSESAVSIKRSDDNRNHLKNESNVLIPEERPFKKHCKQSQSAISIRKNDIATCDTRNEYLNTEKELERDDSNYFKCYADLSIHRVMIGDYSRTQTYRRAILNNYKLFHQKVVLDVGAGTGILSLFCAQAGARKVYAVEASPIAQQARKVIESNGFAEKIIVIQGKVEEVDLPEKVDIIVSEWMGYMLMYESMLPSFLFARDKWLRKDGYLFPEEVKIYIAPISDSQEYEYSVEFWNKVEDAYKIDMSVLVPTAEEQLQASVHVMSVDPASIMSHASCVTAIDLATLEREFSQCAKGSFSCSSLDPATIY